MTNDRKTIKEEKKLFEQKVRQELNDYMAETNEKNIDLDKLHELVELLIALDGDKITDFDVEEAYQRFENRFLKNEEPKKEKRNSRFNRRKAGRIVGFAAAIIFVVFIGGNIGTYATKQMGLVSFIREMDNGVKFHREEVAINQNEITVDSFEEVPKEYQKEMLYPTFIPNDLRLEKIAVVDLKRTVKYVFTYKAEAQDKFLSILAITLDEGSHSIESEFYFEETSKSSSFMLQDKLINVYINEDDEKTCSFSWEAIWYRITTDYDDEVIKKVVSSMEKKLIS